MIRVCGNVACTRAEKAKNRAKIAAGSSATAPALRSLLPQ